MLSTFCMFFKSPSPSRGEGLYRPWCHKILGTGPSMTGARDANSFGRSMIEMLGVLAIIGVLSVGGIAGYSKAMEEYKLDKALGEYSGIVYGLLEHQDSIKKSQPDQHTGIVDIMLAINLIPNSWTKFNSMGLHDAYGNEIYFYTNVPDGSKKIYFDLYLGGKTTNADSKTVSANFSEKLCVKLFDTLAKPLHHAIDRAVISSWNGENSTGFAGDSTCSAGKKCLANATLSDFLNACRLCDKANTYCNFAFWF